MNAPNSNPHAFSGITESSTRQQTIDLQLPLSPPQLHALHGILRSAGAHAPSFRTRIGDDRIYVQLQVTDADERPLSLDRMSDVRRQLGQLKIFESTFQPSVRSAVSSRTPRSEPRAPATRLTRGACPPIPLVEKPPPSGVHDIVQSESPLPLAAAG